MLEGSDKLRVIGGMEVPLNLQLGNYQIIVAKTQIFKRLYLHFEINATTRQGSTSSQNHKVYT